MKRVHVEPGSKDVQVKTGTALTTALLTEHIDLPMACGGNGLCATCHVFIQQGHDDVSPMADKEKRTLSRITSVSRNSRLACQCHVLGDVKVSLPEGEYLEDIQTAENLVGQRAGRNILSPADGRILIKKGQIISKFILRKLENENLNAWSELKGSEKIKKNIL